MGEVTFRQNLGRFNGPPALWRGAATAHIGGRALARQVEMFTVRRRSRSYERGASWPSAVHRKRQHRTDQQLRGTRATTAIIWRKLSYGTRCEPGSRFVEFLSPIIEPCRQQLRHSIDFFTETLAAHNTGKRTPKLHPREVSGDSCFTISDRFHRTGNLGLSGEAAVECLACKFQSRLC